MKSALADQARRDLATQLHRMNAEQRLRAFLTHCQLTMTLYRAGREASAERSRRQARDAD